jgi:enoyl-CoA hydratase/carnithine racemase
MSVLTVEQRDTVALLTLNRPERLNALSRELLTALDEQCTALRADAGVRAVVLTGAGERAFCAGADVTQLDGISPADAFELMRFGQRVLDRLAALPQPVVAAINGVALGGGCEVALACDMRFAAASARFGQPEIKLANVPGWGGTQRLPRLIGLARGSEMILSGEMVDAQTALAWGLANRVVDDERLLEETLAFAASIAEHSAVALAEAKRAIAYGLEHGQAAGLFVEAEAVARCCETEEQRAAVRAFLARRSGNASGAR